jgi:hypothetical protein
MLRGDLADELGRMIVAAVDAAFSLEISVPEAVIRPALPERGADYQSNVALYPNSRTTFAHGGHRFLRCGARMIPFFCLLARKPSSATTRKRKFICSMPAILRWRVVALRSYTPGEGPVFRRIDTTL